MKRLQGFWLCVALVLSLPGWAVAEGYGATAPVRGQSTAWSSGPGTAEPALWGGELVATQVEHYLEVLKPQRLRSVGRTSVVFRAELAGPVDAAFKVSTRSHPYAPQAEVAAYRVGRCLGLRHIPPAVLRKLSGEALAARWKGAPEKLAALRERMRVDQAGQVLVAAIYWVDGLTELGLDNAQGVARMRRWLGQAQSPPPPDQAPLAAQLSALLVFDYLIGNPDRFSGSNMKGTADGSIVYFRDNDLGFPMRRHVQRTRRLQRRLHWTQRFSRRLVGALRGLTVECVTAGAPGLLRTGQARGLVERQQEALSYIDALISRYGPKAVLPFP